MRQAPFSSRTSVWLALAAGLVIIGAYLFWTFGPPSAAPFPTIASLASEIGCEREPFPVTEAESATLRGTGVESSLCRLDADHVLLLSIFEDKDSERTVVNLMRKRVNIEANYLVVGDRFVVSSRTYVLARQVRDAVGGEIEQT